MWFFYKWWKKEIWQTYSIKKGDILKVGKIYEGNWVYLAVFGGFDIKKEFGSNSTTIKESLGGLDGDKLKKGDILPYKSCSDTTKIAIKKDYKLNEYGLFKGNKR